MGLMDQDLKQYLDANFQRIDARFARIEERFAEVDQRIAARPLEIRVDTISKFVMGFDERLALAERRISELERKRAS